ncbi:hypothetical protein GJ744_007792 [Endocarpon pusillum]|uniref:Fungal N-terminal domain-containing protein n=1 Tax=Endocarpon pusillum TaxID=364733 RepID=A0A8H7AVG5_9EURO|nr:hypothetical protein GJ744_007792 [Endocarpon pusillum]
MDGLSSAASGIAVVSLTFQVVESISKLRDFFESMNSAPAVVKQIMKDLQQLSFILDGITVDEKRYTDVLTTSMHKLNQLNTIIGELEPGFESASKKCRQWAAFRTARKLPILKRFRETLEETKTTLILALQAKSLSFSQSSASQLTQIERRIYDDRTASERDTFELFTRQAQLSAYVDNIANHVADLSPQLKSKLIFTESEQINISNQSTQIPEGITKITTTVQNQITRQAFEATVKAAVESHRKAIVGQQSRTSQVSLSTFKESNTQHQSLDKSIQ